MVNAADAEVVLTFQCKALDGLKASKKLADLPVQKPTAESLHARARELADGCKDETGALRIYEQAIKLYPDNPSLLNGMAWLLVTAKDEKVRGITRAVALARKAAKLTDEKDGYILGTLAKALHDSGQLEDAARYAKLAAEKTPGNKDIADRAKEYAKEVEKKE